MTKKPRSKPAAAKPAPREGGVYADLLAQLARTLWLPHDLDEMEKAARLAAARILLEDINPAAGVESLLAVQMVATHEAAMECLRRSMAPDPSPEERDQNLKHSERLLGLYTRQMDVLGRHRAREDNRRERAQKAVQKADGGEPEFGDGEAIRFRRIFLDAKEWWAVRAHVIDPRIILAKIYAQADARDAGLDDDAIEAAGERAGQEAACDLPTVAGKPYSLDNRGVRLYPLPDGRLAEARGITDQPFDEYFDRLRDRDGEAAANRARETAARNGALPNNPWRSNYQPAPQTAQQTNGAAAAA